MTFRPDLRLAVLAVPAALVGSTLVLPLPLASFVWKLFGLPALFPRFADARVITSGWDCARRGVDVLKANPCDPWNRPMNYPRLWLLPGSLGLGADSTPYIALLMIVAFLVAIYFVIGPLSLRIAAYYLLVLISMPVLLLIERGNSDLLVFALLVVVAAAMTRLDQLGIGIASVLILLVTALKLYPIAAVNGLFIRLRGRQQWAALGVVTLAALYALVERRDLALIQASTPRAVSLSYGIYVPIQALLNDLGSHVSRSARLSFVAFVLAVLVGGTLIVARHLPPRRLGGDKGARGTFIGLLFSIGASVYVVTFLLGNNFDYRLVFLVLTVPQLFAWSQSASLRDEAKAILLAIPVSLWLAEVADYPVFFVAQLLLFGLFIYFAAVLLVTALDQLDRRLVPTVLARYFAPAA